MGGLTSTTFRRDIGPRTWAHEARRVLRTLSVLLLAMASASLGASGCRTARRQVSDRPKFSLDPQISTTTGTAPDANSPVDTAQAPAIGGDLRRRKGGQASHVYTYT